MDSKGLVVSTHPYGVYTSNIQEETKRNFRLEKNYAIIHQNSDSEAGFADHSPYDVIVVPRALKNLPYKVIILFSNNFIDNYFEFFCS